MPNLGDVMTATGAWLLSTVRLLLPPLVFQTIQCGKRIACSQRLFSFRFLERSVSFPNEAGAKKRLANSLELLNFLNFPHECKRIPTKTNETTNETR